MVFQFSSLVVDTSGLNRYEPMEKPGRKNHSVNQEWCVMSPSQRRINEIAQEYESGSLIAHGCDHRMAQIHEEFGEMRDKKKSFHVISWEGIRQKLKTISLPKMHRKAVSNVDASSDIRRQSIADELVEFMASPDLRMLQLPEYFPSCELEMIKCVAEEMGLGYQRGDAMSMIFKKQQTLFSLPPPLALRKCSVVQRDEVVVNVPALAQKGRDCFINELRLRRLDSASGLRCNMLWEVSQSSNNDAECPVAAGEGGVYMMKASNGQGVAMFKPMEEEKFVREGLNPGEGAVREEAAYVLDSRNGGFSGVPPTAVAQLHVSKAGKAKNGAVQRFMNSKMGSLEDFGMPNEIAHAAEFVPIDEIHKIGILDIRVFNTDRHPGNILLLGEKAPYALVPIDHGCILPSWFHLAEARFDWANYPQAKVPFSCEMVNKIQNLDWRQDAIELRKLGIREECVTTLRICTMLLQIAAQCGKSLHWIATFMQRSGCLDQPSALEMEISNTCHATEIPFHFIPNEYKEMTGSIELGILSRRPHGIFFEKLKLAFQRCCETRHESVH